ncbi:hypothetical protein [Rhodococcus triatomae]|nr:hypothetical protein G419_14754 [Rhodococcus triatomae BKS 15-14]
MTRIGRMSTPAVAGLAATAVAGLAPVVLWAAPAAAQGSAGTSDLRIEVGYGCRTTGSGPADWRTTAHVFTTVTNDGGAQVRDVVARVAVLPSYTVENTVPVLEPGGSVTFDNDTFANALVLNPVGAVTYGSAPDANPVDNVHAGLAPFVCSAL